MCFFCGAKTWSNKKNRSFTITIYLNNRKHLIHGSWNYMNVLYLWDILFNPDLVVQQWTPCLCHGRCLWAWAPCHPNISWFPNGSRQQVMGGWPCPNKNGFLSSSHVQFYHDTMIFLRAYLYVLNIVKHHSIKQVVLTNTILTWQFIYNNCNPKAPCAVQHRLQICMTWNPNYLHFGEAFIFPAIDS